MSPLSSFSDLGAILRGIVDSAVTTPATTPTVTFLAANIPMMTLPNQPPKIQLLRLKVESSNTHLAKGQKGTVTLTVQGTANQVTLRITNDSPTVIQLTGGQTTVTTQSSGGALNIVRLPFQAIAPGPFVLTSKISGKP